MKIKYFSDTDTVLMEFTSNPVEETLEISENMVVDIDKHGNPVNLTIEHARMSTQLPDLSYQQFEKTA